MDPPPFRNFRQGPPHNMYINQGQNFQYRYPATTPLKRDEESSSSGSDEETSASESSSESSTTEKVSESASDESKSDTDNSTESEEEDKPVKKSPVEIKVRKNPITKPSPQHSTNETSKKQKANPRPQRDSCSDTDDDTPLPPKALLRKPAVDPLLNCVKCVTEISSVGKFQKIVPTSVTYKLIKDYTLNGINTPETGVTVRIHDIFEYNPAAPPTPPKVDISPKGKPKSKTKEKPKPDEEDNETQEGIFQAWIFHVDDDTHKASILPGPVFDSKEKPVLLWSKASKKGVPSLFQQKNGCRAFYDQSSRAFAVAPAEVKQPIRQLLLLCKATPGKVEKSPFGYQHWASKGHPSSGYDTIKAIGRLRPDWENTREIDMMTVPCGKTLEGKLFGALYQNCKRDFNEHFVYEGKRVEIKYAVDVELRPADMLYPKDFSD